MQADYELILELFNLIYEYCGIIATEAQVLSDYGNLGSLAIESDCYAFVWHLGRVVCPPTLY